MCSGFRTFLVLYTDYLSYWVRLVELTFNENISSHRQRWPGLNSTFVEKVFNFDRRIRTNGSLNLRHPVQKYRWRYARTFSPNFNIIYKPLRTSCRFAFRISVFRREIRTYFGQFPRCYKSTSSSLSRVRWALSMSNILRTSFAMVSL